MASSDQLAGELKGDRACPATYGRNLAANGRDS